MVKKLLALMAIVLAVSGCGPTSASKPAAPTSTSGPQVPSGDPARVLDYFRNLNAAAKQGAQAQTEFFRATQHPDFRPVTCDLDGMTMEIEPSSSTLRPDPTWHTGTNATTPRGTIYVVAVHLTARERDEIRGNQVGSQHVVLLDDTAYGFSPCAH